MCPDFKTLSAYFDGEIDLPWAKKIEEHLLNCPKCKQKVSDFYTVSDFLGKYRDEEIYGPMERVWKKISISRRDLKYKSIWDRKVSLPFPAAAAAACIILFFGVLSVFNFINSFRNDFGTMKITRNSYGVTEVQVEGSIQNLEDILASLEKTKFSDEVTIKLPEESEFFIVGEPVYLKSEGFNWKDTGNSQNSEPLDKIIETSNGQEIEE